MDSFVLYLYLCAFIWGAIWGSFLNVVIYRVPVGKSLIKPPSHCPQCQTQLAWYDNVPVLGWLVLRGKCRYCELPIPIRYPMVEALTGILSLSVWISVSQGRVLNVDSPLLEVTTGFLFYFFFVVLLIAIAFIDIDHTIIPHSLTASGVVLGFIASVIIPRAPDLLGLWPGVGWMDALLGLALGGGIIAGLIKGYAYVRGMEGMGWGDFTLMGMCGVWLGWQGVIFVLFLASIQGIATVACHTIFLKLSGRSASDSSFLIEDIDAVPDPMDAERAESPQRSDDLATESDNAETEEVSSETDVVSDESPTDDDDASAPGFGQLAVPFGPFIALAALEYLLFGDRIVALLIGRVP